MLFLCGCQTQPVTPPQPELHNYSNISLDAGFDTVFNYQEAVSDKAVFDARFEQAAELFSHYNDLFDIYNSYEGMNNLYTVNENAGIAPVEVDPEIIELLLKAKEFCTLSGGRFDITIGNLLGIWHEYRTNGIDANLAGEYGSLPDEETLKEAALHSGWDKVEIDEANHTVFITDPEVSLDVGGIAKGFAVEKTALALAQGEELPGAVNAGGNTRTLGTKYTGDPWRVGIQNPDGEGSLLIVRQEGVSSFVTSGDYERFFVAEDGKQYHHIIDPQTLYPADYFRSVSIITPDSADADALSTTLFTMSYEEGLEVIEAFRAAHPDRFLEVIWIAPGDEDIKAENKQIKNGLQIIYTDGLKDRLIFNN